MATSRKDAAKELDVTPQTLSGWRVAPWFPEDGVKLDKRGRAIDWNVSAIRIAKNESQNESHSKKSQEIRLLQETAKLEKLQRENRTEERAEQIEEGNILPRDDWVRFAMEVIGVARDRLKDVPKRLARLVDGEELQRKVITEGERIICAELLRLSQMFEAPIDD